MAGVRIRLIKFEPLKGRNNISAKMITPYWSKACCQRSECASGSKLRRILEPSRGGRGSKLKTAKTILVWIKI